ncbi:hypothetical protein M1D72_06605 [Vibrio sp. AK197]
MEEYGFRDSAAVTQGVYLTSQSVCAAKAYCTHGKYFALPSSRSDPHEATWRENGRIAEQANGPRLCNVVKPPYDWFHGDNVDNTLVA